MNLAHARNRSGAVALTFLGAVLLGTEPTHLPAVPDGDPAPTERLAAPAAPGTERASLPGRTAGTARDLAPPELPVGERLHFSGRFGIFGEVGEGTMSVESDHTVRGREVVRLDFDFEGRAMLRTVMDHTTSWVEPGEGRALRYHKEEKHPLGSRNEAVEIFPEEGFWEDRNGTTRDLASPRPLDELSFIYLVRGLELEEGEVVEIERHFDRERNPVKVTRRGSDTIEVPAGRFAVEILEMRVRDEERFNGGGEIVLYLADDEARTPVRIETKMSRVGTLVLRLEERSPPANGAPLTDRSDARH